MFIYVFHNDLYPTEERRIVTNFPLSVAQVKMFNIEGWYRVFPIVIIGDEDE